MNRSLLLAGLASAVVAGPVFGQSMDHSMHNMPGMTMPAKPAAKATPKPARKAAAKPAAKQKAQVRRAPRRAQAAPARVADPHAGHDMSGMQGMDMGAQQQPAPAQDPHAGHDMSAMPGMGSPAAAGQDPHAGHDMSAMPGMAMDGSQTGAKIGTDLPPGNKPAPAPPGDHLADRFWGADAMASSRENDLRREHGGMTYYQVLFNLAEYQARKGSDGYRWDGEAWVGGDINRLWLKSEGEGGFGKALESAEVQALYSHALDPYWNLQAGVRYDFKPNPSRTYATIGIEGLAPYQFEVEGALFLSDKGDVLARAEGYYDQRITNYFVLQPRVEANFAAQDVRETGIGSGLTDLEAGLRLRYEGRREFAPYIGVSWERQFGDTARFSRARGDDTGGFSFVAGVRTWF
ncbi:copper resistance protein B [Sphingomonas sp. Leaf20]|uniref:copper resistance protein B n=1 Tax=Sphingomonas sp. Leaf20 TaxID=1735685 RepID=UPI0006FFF661|nr:copper resistance protein B [Sphingomonas sp. Leaf20]KQM68881.1 copper resistance protein CopB [Sphingomonas sp. Leaf20]